MSFRASGDCFRVAGAGCSGGGGGGAATSLAAGATGVDLTLSGDLTLNGNLLMGAGKVVELDDGAVGAPGLAFRADLNTGLYRIGADNPALTAGGVKLIDIAAALIKLLSTQTGVADGAVGTPGLSFNSDLDTGLYRIGANNPALAVNGAKLVDFATALIQLLSTQTGIADGLVGAPGLAFNSDLDTGLYRIGANDWGLAAAGALVQEQVASAIKQTVALCTAPTLQTLSAVTDTLLATTSYLRVTLSGSNLALTSTPTIAAGKADGQLLVIENVDASNQFTLQDLSTIPGSTIRNAAGTAKALTSRDTIAYIWSATVSEWRQISTLQAL